MIKDDEEFARSFIIILKKNPKVMVAFLNSLLVESDLEICLRRCDLLKQYEEHWRDPRTPFMKGDI